MPPSPLSRLPGQQLLHHRPSTYLARTQCSIGLPLEISWLSKPINARPQSSKSLLRCLEWPPAASISSELVESVVYLRAST